MYGLGKRILWASLFLPWLFFMPVKKIGTQTKPKKEINYKRILTRKKIIVLDPGHGWENKQKRRMDWGDAYYKCSQKDTVYREANMTLQYAKTIKEMLDPKEFAVYLTREDNKISLPVKDRPKKAKKLNADLFVSIHANNHWNKNEKGFEILYRNDTSLNLAKIASKTFSEILPIKLRRFHKGKYHMMENLEIPSVLIEVGYLSNPEDRKKLFQIEKPDSLYFPYAETATVKTIENYFDKNWMNYLKKPIAKKTNQNQETEYYEKHADRI